MKKLYLPIEARKAASIALNNLNEKYKEQEKMKFKIVRKPGYRYELIENK